MVFRYRTTGTARIMVRGLAVLMLWYVLVGPDQTTAIVYMCPSLTVMDAATTLSVLFLISLIFRLLFLDEKEQAPVTFVYYLKSFASLFTITAYNHLWAKSIQFIIFN